MTQLKQFFNKNFIIIFCTAAFAFVLGGFAWAFFALRMAADSVAGISTPLILHFNDINGITSVGGLGIIVFMGVFGLLIVGMDFAIAREFEKRGGGESAAAAHDPSTARARFFARFLAATTLLFAILLFIAFAAIINVNV